jgi:hypothetical protein
VVDVTGTLAARSGTSGFTEFVSSFLLWLGFFWLGRKELGIGCRERTP